MSIVINLPMDLEEKLIIESNRDGIVLAEQAGLFLSMASALRADGPETEFGDALRSFLRRNQVDPDRLASAFDQLKYLCFKLKPHPASARLPDDDREGRIDQIRLEGTLRRWRNEAVHRPVVEGATASVDVPSRQDPSSIRGKYAYLGLSSEDFMREKQMEIDREDRKSWE